MKIARVQLPPKESKPDTNSGKSKSPTTGKGVRQIKAGYQKDTETLNENDKIAKECFRVFDNQTQLECVMKKKENVWAHFQIKKEMTDEKKERYESFVSGFLHYYDNEIRNGMTDHTLWCDWKKKAVTVYLDPAPLRHPLNRDDKQPTIKTVKECLDITEETNKLRQDTFFSDGWKLPGVQGLQSDPPTPSGPPPPGP